MAYHTLDGITHSCALTNY